VKKWWQATQLFIVVLVWSCRREKMTTNNCANHHHCGVVLETWRGWQTTILAVGVFFVLL
jgi:hypothetical protein